MTRLKYEINPGKIMMDTDCEIMKRLNKLVLYISFFDISH